jgi:hypothetical protein
MDVHSLPEFSIKLRQWALNTFPKLKASSKAITIDDVEKEQQDYQEFAQEWAKALDQDELPTKESPMHSIIGGRVRQQLGISEPLSSSRPH